MSEPSNQANKKKKKESSFFILIKGIGCFFFLFSLFIFVSTLICIYLFGPTVSAIRLEDKLPDFDGPTEQDFWSLQEKKLELDKQKDGKEFNNITFSQGQFNALLSSVRIPPVSGFYLSKIRHSYINKELRYYLIGSGYMLRKFVISFVIFNNQSQSYPSEIKINSLKVEHNSLIERYVKNLITECAIADKSGLLNNIITGEFKPKFIEGER